MHPLLKVWKEYFKVPPARTTVGTTGLLVKDTLVEIDLIGFVPGNCCFQRWRAGVGSCRAPVCPSDCDDSMWPRQPFCYRLVRRGSENPFCSQKPPLPDTVARHCAKE
jgi:hypothetical protein